MHYSWLRRDNLDDCILFFAGWGMDPTPFQLVDPGNVDLCMVYDYRQLEPVPMDPFTGYTRIHLVAWSMGVWAAGQLLADNTALFATRTAIGGTLTPIDDKNGIPQEKYNHLTSTFNKQTLFTFYHDMFDDAQQATLFLAHHPKRTVSELREELEAFRAAFYRLGSGRNIFSKKIITSRDRIFSARNQLRAWGKDNGTRVAPWPHFPFYSLSGWCDLTL